MTSSDPALLLALPLGVIILHAIFGAVLAVIVLAVWSDPPPVSRWAGRATAIAIILAAATFVYLIVRLVLLTTDAGGYDANNEYHSAALLGLIALPVVVVTTEVSRRVATRRRANAGDFVNRYLTDWTAGVLGMGVLAGPLLVLLALFPFR